ncbi:MAG: hypothetical protein QOG04_993 [Actinomycetota bacterium]|nr:hypothetical protein [Actinomycetota bacterium]
MRLLVSPLTFVALLSAALPSAAQEAEHNRSSAHFTITWSEDPSDPSMPDLTDANADGAPDAIEKLLEIFEAARSFQIDVLGLRPPPNDNDYPLYVNPGAATLALPGEGTSRPSYILVRPNLVQEGWTVSEMRTFAAHEYAHAIQFGYDYHEDDWIMEASATWMEGAFNGEARPNLGALPYFLPFPRQGLTTVSEAHEYGAFLFVQFLIERYADGDSAFMRTLWETLEPSNVSSLVGIESILSSKGVTIYDMWREFMLWNWRLGKYEQGRAYRKAVAGLWPLPLHTTDVVDESCRLSTDGGSPYTLPALSGDYARLQFIGARPKIGVLRLAGPPATTATAIVTSPEEVVETPLTFDSEGIATFPGFFGRRGITKILLALGNGSVTPQSISVVYSVVLDGASSTTASAPSGPASTTFGSATGLFGSVTCGGNRAPSVALKLIEVDKATGTRTELPLTTDFGGSWGALIAPQSKSTYWVEVDDPWISDATSPTTTISVNVFVEMTVQAEYVALGSPARLDGGVFPAHNRAVVQFEFRRPGGLWRPGPVVRTDTSGNYSGDIVFPRKGVWEVRARVTDTGDDDHLPNLSVARTVVVEP